MTSRISATKGAILALCSAAAAVLMRADVGLNPLFSDGAVLQRDQVFPIWGTADEGEKITVTIQGRETVTICRRGRWRADLPALRAGGPFEMTIAGKNKITLKNLLVGEVWLCGGQSNMDLTVGACDRAEQEIASSANAQIRLCKVPRQPADESQETAEVAWQECGPQSVATISGVGYFFARDLQAALKVPVGIIDAAHGGSPAEAWMSPAALGSREFQPILDDYAARVKDGPRAMTRFEADLAAWKLTATQEQHAGRTPPAQPEIPMGPLNFRRPSGLYRGMIAPLVPFAIRGVIWYQGERNAPRARQYRTLFPALIADWRHLWQQGDFPFLFVQLAPFGARAPEPRESAWADLREAQLFTSQTVPRTAMAVITDVGDELNIHPKRKQPVGARLALAARAVAYGEPLAYSGPTYQGCQVRDDRIEITFSNIGQGLVCRGDRLEGFAISGADGRFVNAEAEIVGQRVVVHSSQIAQPQAVRFGWADYPVVNLWNTDGLPASPFRTDNPN